MISAAVIQFPGSNCDADAYRALEATNGIRVRYHWYQEPLKPGADSIILLPGGFSFGDYLRAGALAALSPAVQSLPEAIEAGAHVLGICNGFQMLLEARLLPGYLQVNESMRFVSQHSEIKLAAACFPWVSEELVGKVVRFPIAHRFGNYQVPSIDHAELSIACEYVNNPNGSFKNIAGIYRSMGKGSVMGMMPHPERASFAALRLEDGKMFWAQAVRALS
jgi:phosphoribosylformylglycinamidine synthase